MTATTTLTPGLDTFEGHGSPDELLFFGRDGSLEETLAHSQLTEDGGTELFDAATGRRLATFEAETRFWAAPTLLTD